MTERVPGRVRKLLSECRRKFKNDHMSLTVNLKMIEQVSKELTLQNGFLHQKAVEMR